MKVLIFGATGFVGFPIAQALVRAGHTVYGLARSEGKAKTLAAEEIIPILGDTDSDEWIPLIASLDLIIDALPGSLQTREILARVVSATQTHRPTGAPLLSYIYTSGTWMHGDSRTAIVNDTTPITKPVDLMSWRPAVEQLVLKSKEICGIVVRPSLVYGRSGSLLAPLFKAAADSAAAGPQGSTVTWPGTPGGRCPTIHVDDCAEFYLRVAERASMLGGKVFDASNSSTESVDDILQTVVKVSGAKGYEYKSPENKFEEALQSTSLVRPYLGHALLGWRARKPSMVDGMEIYYAAWRATSA
ncbi:hypothetical protein FB45DRAFT_841367 [Roridomyces roridus]|uniref:NAD-dependent epimerase/dehydratase domain-containing protein n=1 Tax=Roridomyces roridus TaxID=1738132 RepID=A0AAD7BBM5_9AGAR|nr:hypothetical protein FB45DRAFT_841367 [Roridomyces roridus]